MEELESLIGFQKIRRYDESIMKPTAVLLQMCSPIRRLMIFAGFQKPENAFQVSVSFRIAIRFQLILIVETNLIHHLLPIF